MKKIVYLLSLLLIAAFSVNAQTVVMCGAYDKETGVTSDVFAQWDVNADGGGYVYTVYSQKKKIKGNLTLKVEKKNEYDSYALYGEFIFPSGIKVTNWAVYDMLFTEEGNYKLSVMNKSKVLATTETDIFFIVDDLASDDTSYVDETYYELSYLTFGESVDEEGTMTGESTVFSLTNGSLEVRGMVEMDDPMLLTKLYVDVTFGEEVILNDSYDVPSKDWGFIHFPVTVTKPGIYFVDLYTQDDVYITGSSFEVTE